MKRDKLEICIL